MTAPAMQPMMASGCCGSEAKAEAEPETSARSEGPCCGPAVGSDAPLAADATAQKTSCC
jgi:hypothetical protein